MKKEGNKKMNLKEAFRYQNFLAQKIYGVACYLSNEANITTVIEKHNINSVMKDKENKEVARPKDDEEYTSASVMDMVDFLLSLEDEKEKLTAAIDATKANQNINIDSVVAINKDIQRILAVVQRMGDTTSKERETTGTEYTFNGEGNQISVRYPVTVVTTIDFDRTAVKAIAKKLSKKIDESSTKRDMVLVTAEVEGFEPKYDVNDSLEEMVESFLAKK